VLVRRRTRVRSTSENDSDKDDLADDARLDQSGLARRGSGVAGSLQADSSIELLGRRTASRHQEDVRVYAEAGPSADVGQSVVTDRPVLAGSTGAGPCHRQSLAGQGPPVRLESCQIRQLVAGQSPQSGDETDPLYVPSSSRRFRRFQHVAEVSRDDRLLLQYRITRQTINIRKPGLPRTPLVHRPRRRREHSGSPGRLLHLPEDRRQSAGRWLAVAQK